jgi:hypothetical protein
MTNYPLLKKKKAKDEVQLKNFMEMFINGLLAYILQKYGTWDQQIPKPYHY